MCQRGLFSYTTGGLFITHPGLSDAYCPPWDVSCMGMLGRMTIPESAPTNRARADHPLESHPCSYVIALHTGRMAFA